MSRLLLVDDDPEVHDLLCQAVPEHEIEWLPDWTKVSGRVFAGNWDLILMDVNMPVLGGDKLVPILQRAARDRAPLRIVLFSAMAEDRLLSLTRELGAHGYLPKTFDGERLRAKLNRLLRTIEPPQARRDERR
jgi:DNA-binding response OmpR family regulator